MAGHPCFPTNSNPAGRICSLRQDHGIGIRDVGGFLQSFRNKCLHKALVVLDNNGNLSRNIRFLACNNAMSSARGSLEQMCNLDALQNILVAFHVHVRILCCPSSQEFCPNMWFCLGSSFSPLLGFYDLYTHPTTQQLQSLCISIWNDGTLSCNNMPGNAR